MRPFIAVLLLLLAGVITINGLAAWDRVRHEETLRRASAAFQPGQALLGYRDTDERRFQKARLAVIPRPRIVVFGSSRVMLVSTTTLDRPAGTFYNAGLSGGTIEDWIVLWTVLRDHAKVPETAVFAIDSWSFNAGHPEVRWLTWTDDVQRFVDTQEGARWASGHLAERVVYRWYQAKELLSYAVFRASISDLGRLRAGRRRGADLLRSLSHQIVPEAELNGRRALRADGSLVYEQDFEQRPPSVVRVDAAVSLARNKGGLTRFEWNTERSQRLDLLWTDMRARGVRLLAYVPPYHPVLWDGIARDSAALDATRQTRRFLVSLGERHQVRVLDFSDPSTVPCGEEDFLDDVHTREACLERIMTRLAVRTPS